MKKHRGFTLVELLVVIGIIALLISILLPALSKARKSANNVKCLANLHQLSIAFTAYLTNNRGKAFPYTYSGMTDPYFDTWQQELRPYYAAKAVTPGQYEDTSRSIRLCPEASNFLDTQFTNGQAQAWGDYQDAWDYTDTNAKDSTGLALRLFSSYGINGWVYSTPTNANDLNSLLGFSATGTEAQYQSQEVYANQGLAASTPFIADAIRLDGWPYPTDPGPIGGGYDLKGGLASENSGIQMARYVSMRHGKTTNVAFLDGHAAPVPLSGLWKLRWYNGWKPARIPPTFPPGST